MSTKQAPLGICDLCGEPFPPGVSRYTNKGQPRRFCSLNCRQTHNSRTGAPIRSRKAKARVRRGEWKNPAEALTDEEICEYARRGGKVRARQHKEALQAGTWQNPADAPGAREKLSRPRVHGDDPVLHSALSKLKADARMTELTAEEAERHRRYRADLRARRRDHWRAYYREQYRRSMATAEGRAAERQRWERQQEQRLARGPNQALRRARERAGYSQQRLADELGVAQTTVSGWERYSSRPRDEMQQRVAELLGMLVEDIFGSR